MIQLNNDALSVTINPMGAELQRIFHHQFQLDYLWNGNPAFWGKHAPVLFPVVGQLKSNSYIYKHQNYSLPRHGFARDMVFQLVKQENNVAIFELISDESTLEVYPFHFSLQIKYVLIGNVLTTEYSVHNRGADTLWFSVGGHPAFNVPLVNNTQFEDYFLEWEHPETVDRWPLQEGLLSTHPVPFLNQQKIIPLNHDLFKKDAVVLKNLSSTVISLRSHHTTHGLTMKFDGFPYFGIWAANDAPFVCLEPWCGHADSLYHNGQLTEKEGMIALGSGQDWCKQWEVMFY